MTVDDLIAELRLYEGDREVDVMICDTSKLRPDGYYPSRVLFVDTVTQKVLIAADIVQRRCRVSGTKPNIEAVE